MYGTPALDDEVIFVGSYDGKLHAISIDEGKLLETEPVTEEFVAGPLYHKGIIYIGSSDGSMYAYKVQRESESFIGFELNMFSGNFLSKDKSKFIFI